MKNPIEKPEGIILTIGASYLKERGVKKWIEDFMNAMNNPDRITYWMRLPVIPKQEPLYIYLVIGNHIKYRFNFVCFEHGGEFTFDDGRTIRAKAWMIGVGPLAKPPYKIKRKGFRGFRYCDFIF
jgi:hypothetical protein